MACEGYRALNSVTKPDRYLDMTVIGNCKHFWTYQGVPSGPCWTWKQSEDDSNILFWFVCRPVWPMEHCSLFNASVTMYMRPTFCLHFTLFMYDVSIDDVTLKEHTRDFRCVFLAFETVWCSYYKCLNVNLVDPKVLFFGHFLSSYICIYLQWWKHLIHFLYQIPRGSCQF